MSIDALKHSAIIKVHCTIDITHDYKSYIETNSCLIDDWFDRGFLWYVAAGKARDPSATTMRARQRTCTKLRKLSVSAGLIRSIGELNEAIATSQRSVEAEFVVLRTAST